MIYPRASYEMIQAGVSFYLEQEAGNALTSVIIIHRAHVNIKKANSRRQFFIWTNSWKQTVCKIIKICKIIVGGRSNYGLDKTLQFAFRDTAYN